MIYIFNKIQLHKELKKVVKHIKHIDDELYETHVQMSASLQDRTMSDAWLNYTISKLMLKERTLEFRREQLCNKQQSLLRRLYK
jgi:hypothetical protein